MIQKIVHSGLGHQVKCYKERECYDDFFTDSKT